VCTDPCAKGKKIGGNDYAFQATGEYWAQGEKHYHNTDPNDKTYSKSEGSWVIGTPTKPNLQRYIEGCKNRKKYKKRHKTAMQKTPAQLAAEVANEYDDMLKTPNDWPLGS